MLNNDTVLYIWKSSRFILLLNLLYQADVSISTLIDNIPNNNTPIDNTWYCWGATGILYLSLFWQNYVNEILSCQTLASRFFSFFCQFGIISSPLNVTCSPLYVNSHSNFFSLGYLVFKNCNIHTQDDKRRHLLQEEGCQRQKYTQQQDAFEKDYLSTVK